MRIRTTRVVMNPPRRISPKSWGTLIDLEFMKPRLGQVKTPAAAEAYNKRLARLATKERAAKARQQKRFAEYQSQRSWQEKRAALIVQGAAAKKRRGKVKAAKRKLEKARKVNRKPAGVFGKGNP